MATVERNRSKGGGGKPLVPAAGGVRKTKTGGQFRASAITEIVVILAITDLIK